MAFFAIADLHLSFARPKPMDIFGAQWVDHVEKIAARWREGVGENDTVLVAGDISWAMTFAEAEPDLRWIHELPGQKILIRGNHDYWWDRVAWMRARVPSSIRLLHNDSIVVGGVRIAGARGWDLPGKGWKDDPAADEKLYLRERGRLRMSLDSARGELPILVMMHYPPFYTLDGNAGFHDLLRDAGAHTVVFGHLHGPDGANAWQGTRDGVRYVFCACDGIDFSPVLLGTVTNFN